MGSPDRPDVPVNGRVREHAVPREMARPQRGDRRRHRARRDPLHLRDRVDDPRLARRCRRLPAARHDWRGLTGDHGDRTALAAAGGDHPRRLDLRPDRFSVRPRRRRAWHRRSHRGRPPQAGANPAADAAGQADRLGDHHRQRRFRRAGRSGRPDLGRFRLVPRPLAQARCPGPAHHRHRRHGRRYRLDLPGAAGRRGDVGRDPLHPRPGDRGADSGPDRFDHRLHGLRAGVRFHPDFWFPPPAWRWVRRSSWSTTPRSG